MFQAIFFTVLMLFSAFSSAESLEALPEQRNIDVACESQGASLPHRFSFSAFSGTFSGRAELLLNGRKHKAFSIDDFTSGQSAIMRIPQKGRESYAFASIFIAAAEKAAREFKLKELSEGKPLYMKEWILLIPEVSSLDRISALVSMAKEDTSVSSFSVSAWRDPDRSDVLRIGQRMTLFVSGEPNYFVCSSNIRDAKKNLSGPL